MKTNQTTTKQIILCAGLLLLGLSAAWADSATYTNAGTFTWTCPVGVSNVQIQAWGGGGAGGSAHRHNSNSAGGGGGGGAYASTNTVSVIPGTNYSIVVGGGGPATTTTTSANGTAAPGTNSWFGSATTTNCLAAGGGGGADADNGYNTAFGSGGAVANCIGSTASYAGGNGQGGSGSHFAGGGGSGAGTNVAGGNAYGSYLGGTNIAGGGWGGNGVSGVTTAVGSPGQSPGGAGGAGANYANGTETVGGNGAAGEVVLNYTVFYDKVNVETAANGSGSSVPAQNVPVGNSITVYSIGRTSGNVFMSNAPAVWSLVNISGGVVSGDLVAAGDFKSAVFTAHAGGSANIQAVVSGYTGQTNVSGLITVLSANVWTNNADSAWTTAVNWDPNVVPGNPGDTAVLGKSTGLRTVTLGANESLGILNFTNPNSFVVTGSSVLTMDNGGSAANINVSGGTANAIQTPVTLKTNTTVTVNSGDSLAISGVVSNAPSVNKTLTVLGAGTLALSGNNSYGPASAGTTGTTLSGGGTLQVGNNNALGAGDLSVTASGILQAGAAVTLPNNIVLGSAVNLTNDNNSYNVGLNGVISGTSGTLYKTGSGTLTLGNANTYYFSTYVTAGTLKLGAANAIPNGGSTSGWLILDGGASAAGTLDLNGYSPTVNALSGLTGTVVGQIVNNSGAGTSTLTVSSGNATGFAGNILDNTNSTSGTVALALGGTTSLTLSGANTFSGGVTVGAGQTLKFGSANAIGTGTLTINGGTNDSTVASLVNANNNPQNWNGDFVFAGTQSLNLGTGAVTLGANRIVTVSNNPLTVGGTISGAFSLQKAGGNKLELVASNSYSGGTSMNGGILLVDDSNGLGTGPVSLTTGGGSVQLGNGVTITNSYNNGSASTYDGMINCPSGSATWSGPVGASGSGGLRLITTGGTLTLTGSGTSRGVELEYGNFIFAGSAVWGNANGSGNQWNFGRDNGDAGRTESVILKDSAIFSTSNTGLGMGGGHTTGAITVTLQGSASLNLGTGWLDLHQTSSGTAANTVNLNGGTLTVGAITNSDSARTVTVNLNGGTLKAASSSSAFFGPLTGVTATINTNGFKVNDNGSSVTIGQALFGSASPVDGGLTKSGAGTVTLTNANSYYGGTVVSAGTLNINGINALGGANYGGLTLTNGGTLQYATAFSGNGSGDLTSIGSAGITLALGGGTIDLNGNSVSYASAIGNSGTGSLTVKSSGSAATLTLNGANSYSGNTLVSSNSTLLLASGATIGSSPQITVASGGLLDVSASGLTLGSAQTLVAGRTSAAATDVNGSVTNNGTLIVGGTGTIGTLTINNGLTLENLSTNKFDIVGTNADAINLGSSTLTLNATATIDVTETAINAGTYHLITAASISGTVGNLSLVTHGVLGRFTAALQVTSTTVDLVVSDNPTNLVWQGYGGNSWVNDVTILDWTNVPGGQIDYFWNGDFVTFDDTAYFGYDTVNISGLVAPGSVTVNATNNISFNGPGNIAGSTGLAKQNTGTLTIAATNTYTGVTTISGGTVSVGLLANGGSVSAIGAASTNPANLVLDGGTLSYTGGNVSIDRDFTLTTNGGTIAANGGGYLRITPGSVQPITMSGTGNRTLTLAGTASGFGSTTRLYLGLTVGDPSSGSTTLKKTGTGSWTMNITGHTYTGDTIIDQGTIETIVNDPFPFGTGKGNLVIGSAGIFACHSQGVNINALNDGTGGGGAITTSLAANGASHLIIGNGNASGSFSGTINFGIYTIPVSKTGTGTQILSGANTYPGGTTISGGALLVNSPGSISGSSSVTVQTNAMLGGSGTISSPTTFNGGAVLYGGAGGIGTLTIGTNLTLTATSTNLFVVTTAGGASNSVAVTSGTFTPNASIIKINTAGDANLGAGTNVLFNYSGSTLANAFNATPVFVTAQTGAATNAYIYDTGSQIELVVTNGVGGPVVSTDASLSFLALSPAGTLSPGFSSGVTNYTAGEANANSLVAVTVTNTSAFATNVLFLNGVAQATNAGSLVVASLPLVVGSANALQVQVTAQDGTTVSNYFVTVTRAASSNALLTSLALTPAGTLYPSFNSATNSYNATNTCANNPLTVTVTNADLTATNTLFLNGVSQGLLTNGLASTLLTLATGANNVTVQVVSQDLSVTNDYVVAATLTAPPTVSVNSATNCGAVATLLTATTSASSPTYSWSPGGATTASITVTPSSTTIYTVTVTDGTTGCANSGSGTITVNPVPVVTVNSTNIYAGGSATLTATNAASSPSYLWSPGGATTQTITVSPSTNTTYTVTVTDGTTGCVGGGSGTVTILPSTNALLASLSLTPAGTLFPTFATNVYSYNATNTYANKTVTVAAGSVNANATLALNLNGGGYGAAVTNSLSISGNTLGLPTNTVAVRVVSQDLSQTNVYTVNVLLQPSQTVPKLTNSVSGTTLTLSWPADHLGYRLLVQTNNLNKGVSGNINDWGTVSGSQSVITTNITIIKTGVTNVYYKLVYP